MTINPRDYDLDELRELARERGDASRPGASDDGGRAPSGDDESRPDMSALDGMAGGPSRERFQSGLYRELLPLESGAGNLEKPYLHSLPESYGAEYVIFEWLEFLLERFGYQGATEALGYYESVGWITEDVKRALDDYMLGIDAPASEGEGNIDDHKLSLVYVARLASMH